MAAARRRLPPFALLGGLLALLVVGGYLVWNGQHQRGKAIATAQTWSIAGTPCPSLSKAQFEAQVYPARREFEYGGVTFARHAGHVDCAAVAADGGKGRSRFPVCSFTSPVVIKVVTEKGESYFVPGPGKPATVSTQDGAATCVLASDFKLPS